MVAALELLLKVLADDWKDGKTKHGHDVGRMYEVVFGRPHADAAFLESLKRAILDQKFLFEPDPGIVNLIPELENLWDELTAEFYRRFPIYQFRVSKSVTVDQRCVEYFRDHVTRFIPKDRYWHFARSKEELLQRLRFERDLISRQIDRLALDADSRPVVAMVPGDRSEATAPCLWDALPAAYRDRATARTDFWSAYTAAVPADRHVASGKGDGQTNHVERFWCTLRQRCARLVRKTLSFSKCLENHLGAIWYFIRLYNASLP